MEPKTYKGLVLWAVMMVAASIGGAYLPIEDTRLLSRITLNICTLSIAVLAFIIYRTGRAYWYSGITYEQAVSAGMQKCKAYALKHFRDFGLFALAFLLFSILSWCLHLSFWIDLFILFIGLIAICIHTMRYKL